MFAHCDILVDNVHLTPFSALSYLPAPLMMFPGITFKINDFHLNPCLKICSLETQSKSSISGYRGKAEHEAAVVMEK